jgi:hypothetical protein
VLEVREETVEVVDEPEALEIGLTALVEKHGMQKIVDAVGRMSSGRKG